MATKQITQKDIDIFCRRAKALTESKKKQEALRGEIINFMVAGGILPSDGPWVVELAQNGGTKLSWEEEFAKLHVKYLKLTDDYTKSEAEALTRARMEDIKKNAPEKDPLVIQGISYTGGVKLTPKINASFRRKRVAA